MRRIFRRQGACLLAVLLLPGVGDGGRAAVDGRAAPWSSLVRVQIPGAARCTGVVIAPRQVLTAAHCLFIRRVGHFAPPESVHVLSFYSGGAFGRHTVAARYATLPGWLPEGKLFGLDAALLTLAQDVGAPALPLADAVPGPAGLAGYNQDRGEVLAADPQCRVVGFAADAGGNPLVRHDCAATRGTSGAALFVRQGEGWAVGGVQTGASQGRGGIAVPAATLRLLGG